MTVLSPLALVLTNANSIVMYRDTSVTIQVALNQLPSSTVTAKVLTPDEVYSSTTVPPLCRESRLVGLNQLGAAEVFDHLGVG